MGDLVTGAVAQIHWVTIVSSSFCTLIIIADRSLNLKVKVGGVWICSHPLETAAAACDGTSKLIKMAFVRRQA